MYGSMASATDVQVTVDGGGGGAGAGAGAGSSGNNNSSTRSNDGKVLMPDKPPTLEQQSSSQSGRIALGAGLAVVRAVAKFKSLAGGAVVQEQFYCRICMCNEAVTESYALDGCQHRFCKDCVGGYLAVEINEGHVLGLTCPHDEDHVHCDAPFKDADVKTLVDATTYEKFTRFTKMKTDDKYRACPKCNKLQLGDPAHPAMTCDRTSCGHKFCYAHSDAHPDTTCSEYRRRHLAEEQRNEEFINANAVRCPSRQCGLPVIKSSGCNHMTCSHCHTQFCYLCRRPVNHATYPNHFKWWNVCGCPGMQMRENMRGNTPCKMCCYRVSIFLLFLVCVFPCAIVVGSLGFVWWLVLVILCCPCWCVLCLVVQSEERRQLTRGVCCFWYIIGLMFGCVDEDD